jgi:acetyl-CoA carboxylase carboxyltransferase component
MARINLEPIGSPLSHKESGSAMDALESKLDEKRKVAHDGWGETYARRIHERGKLTASERVQLLAGEIASGEQAASNIFYFGTFVNDGDVFHADGGNGRTSPQAGVITAFVRVHGRWVIAIANDNTVASGSWWPRSPEKIIRAQEIALKLKIPVVYLVDCSGLFLPEQGRTFPGKTGAGHIFKMNSLLSDAGVPQVAGVFGDCIAGGGYMPIISDKVYMTESAYMVIAGAALIQGAKSQNLSSLDIGGADVHVHLSGCADWRVPDDETCVEKIREEIASMASPATTYYRRGVDAAPPRYSPDELRNIVPAQGGQPYAVRELIARLVDDSLFKECFEHTGREVVVGVARIAGLYVGIAANVQELLPHPHDANRKRPGGILYKEGVAKLSAFSRICSDDGIPLVWLQDVAGFDIGVEAEKQGLLGFGSSLIYSNSTTQAPFITVLVRKASGAGYYAMAGMPFDPIVQLSTPAARLSVMDGKTLAIGAYRTKLDDNFQIASSDPEERARIEAGMKAARERIEADMSPYRSARDMATDEVVKLGELRAYLECVVEASYQAQGARRIKNPRIWSLHDWTILDGPKRDTLAHGVEASASNKHDAERERIRSSPTSQSKDNQVLAPMEGMFYTRPTPKDPLFAAMGSVVNPGDTLGLIEVMKCFYPVKWEGKKAQRVVDVVVKESGAVKAGETLFVLSDI